MIQLDDIDILDIKPDTKNRHGKPLDLYIETGIIARNPTYSFPRRRKSGLSVNCAEVILVGQFAQYKELNRYNSLLFKEWKELELQSEMRTCSELINDMGYVTDSLTSIERNFPIAYSILVYKDFVQIEMLLRAIYRPQNIYCHPRGPEVGYVTSC